jgi:hypothetical protein
MEQREQDRIASAEMAKLADLLRREGYEINGIKAPSRPYVSDGHAGVCLSVNVIRYVPLAT